MSKRKKSTSNSKANTILVVCVFSVLIVVFFLFYYFNQHRISASFLTSASPIVKENSQEFVSNVLGFSVIIPEGFLVKSKVTTVVIYQGGSKLSINRVANNFNNLTDHINTLKRNNKLTFRNLVKSESSNPEEMIIDIIEGDVIEKSYFIYFSPWVYSISTTEPELYDELEEVVASFKYLGE